MSDTHDNDNTLNGPGDRDKPYAPGFPTMYLTLREQCRLLIRRSRLRENQFLELDQDPNPEGHSSEPSQDCPSLED